MIFWPFDVKNAPALVYLRVLLPFDGTLDERERNAMGMINFDPDSRVLGYTWQLLDAVDVVRLGGTAFAEDDDRRQLRPSCCLPSKWLRISPPRAHWSADQSEGAEQVCFVYVWQRPETSV
jgi:hypothetical protein